MHYKFCPECGSRLVDREAGDDGMVPYCEHCQRYWFDAFDSCVIILVVNEYGEIALLCQSYISTQYETFVAGFMKPGETAEETAEREVEEELGIRTDRLESAGTYWFGQRNQLMHGFIGFARKQEFVLSPEVDAAEWVPMAEADARMFPNTPENTQRRLIEKYHEMILEQERKN